VLTFVGMFALLLTFFAAGRQGATTWYGPVMRHASFVELWFSTLDGKLQPTMLLFPLSLTILGLFMTVKVLEARKWS
jgi:ABC-2 type transport system permease protein